MKNLVKLVTLGLVAGLAVVPTMSFAQGWHRGYYRSVWHHPIVRVGLSVPVYTAPVYAAPVYEAPVVVEPIYRVHRYYHPIYRRHW